MKLLDSSVLVDLDRGGDAVEARAARLDQEGRHAISAVTVTELFYGIETAYDEGTEDHREACEGLQALISRFELMPLSGEVARRGAELMARLRAEGTSLNDLHDIYIAATALTHRQALLTSNVKDFERIDGLSVEDWGSF